VIQLISSRYDISVARDSKRPASSTAYFRYVQWVAKSVQSPSIDEGIANSNAHRSRGNGDV
jgi:hypothetical protein